MRTVHRRLRAAAGAVALSGSLWALTVPTATIARADTTQTDACLGVTGTFTTFNFPVTGSLNPTSVTSGATTTLSGLGLSFTVDALLVSTGVRTGLVQAAPTLADLGTSGGTGGTLKGQNAVTADASAAKLVLSGTNSTEGKQTAANTASISFTFWVVSDGVTTKIYTGTPNPPSNSALTQVTTLSVPVAFGNTTWTSNGAGNIAVSQAASQPGNLVSPTPADQAAAPLSFAAKINNFVNISFYCWPGTQANAAGNGMTPGTTSAIATAAGPGGSTTSTTAGGTTTTTTGGTTTTTAAGGTTTTTAAGGATTTTSAASVTVAPGATSSSGTKDYTATCTNTLTPDKSQLTFSVAGTAPAQVTAGAPVTLTKQTWKVAVPGQLLDTGINLGLLSPGATVSGKVTPGVFASNTKEGLLSAAPVTVAFGPIVSDGATGHAQPASSTFALGDLTWSSVGGTIGYEMAKTTVEIAIGTIKVGFTCTPDTKGAFVTTAVSGATGVRAASNAGGTHVEGASLARTGPHQTLPLIIAALALIDLGYLAFSATLRGRRRQVDG